MTEGSTVRREDPRRKMNTSARLHAILIPLFSLLAILCAIGVSNSMAYIRAADRTQKTLRASAAEQADLLQTKLDGQLDTLKAIAADLAAQTLHDDDTLVERLKMLVQHTSFRHICFAKANGASFMDDGKTNDVSGREYFQNALRGEWAIQRLENPYTGDGPLFVLAIPVLKGRQVVGVLHGSYDAEVLEKLIIPESYDGQAYSFICDADGDLLVGSENPEYAFTEENVFLSLAKVKLDNGLTLEGLKASVAGGAGDAFSYRSGRGKRYAVYMPLDVDSATGERWVMFNALPGGVVEAEVTAASRLNLMLFALVLLAAGATFCYLFNRERKNAAVLKRERDQFHAIEEQDRLAVAFSGLLLARYDLKTGVYHNSSDILFQQGFGKVIENVPEVFIEKGMVAPECEADFRAFYQNLRQGVAGVLVVSLKTPEGDFRWFRKDATFVRDATGQPYQAIVAYRDITEEREKEAVYTKWLQSVRGMDPETYTLFRCDLSKGASFDVKEGALLRMQFAPHADSFNARTREYAGRCVHLDDFDAYTELMDSDHLLASYYRGVHTVSLDYRERVSRETYRWLRVTVEMVQHTDSKDIEAFLMYQNIDEARRNELAQRERVETDSITGVLNRAAFIHQFNAALRESPNERHALVLLDMDDFKQVNDTFGHEAGDRTLREVAENLRAEVGENDLLGRLGGDEFLIGLLGVPNTAVIEKIIMRIQAQIHRALSLDVQLSASIGVAVSPDDGACFEELYHRVDVALYAAKEGGRDTYAFYGGGDAKRLSAVDAPPKRKTRTMKHRMMVIDDDPGIVTELTELFGDSYDLVVCSEESAAVNRLHRYGLTLSVVLLGLNLPALDGFQLLKKIQASGNVNAVPVIVMGNEDDRALCLTALKQGACDMILKPFVPELLKVRVSSAVTKAENERLRAQNASLQQQSGDGVQYRTVFESMGTAVVEYDWSSGRFSYDPAMARYLYGKYDDRSLWQILLSDMVADVMDVKALQEMVHSLAFDRTQNNASMDIMLKTPDKLRHWFNVHAFKRVNDLNLTSRVVLTFRDVNDNVLSDEKLRFQAEHDALTGLFSRDAFLSRVESAVRSKPANTYLLVYCDIDGFRALNQRFGRAEGDKLLQYAAEKLQGYADAAGGFAGRLSSDNYAVLLQSRPELPEKMERIIHDFFAGYPLSVKITCRAGAYRVEDPAMSTGSMLDMAALAKDSIKGKYMKRLAMFDKGMNDRVMMERDVTDHMEAALLAGHFDIFVQPQYDHLTGLIVGAEALARWIDPVRGVISPGLFVPIFEKNGFITKMDEYIWERTAAHLRAWLDQGNQAVPISVNVSRADLNDPALCHKLLALAERYRLPPNALHLEITESLFAEDAEGMTQVVETLHSIGFLIEMDDFGSGYSSLNILKNVPVDILKLDMQFFAGGDALNRGGIIINAVLRMAAELNIPVIAEGVETREQADFLLSLGCRTIQGFLYAKPMPTQEFEEKLTLSQAAQRRTAEG